VQENKHLTNSTANKSAGSNLCDAILQAADLLNQVRLGVSLTEALSKTSSENRSAAQSLSFEALRFKPRIIQGLQGFLHKPLDPEVEDLFVIALSTLFDESANHYAAHTLVNEVVKAADKSLRTRHAKGLLNAVLRRVIENPQVLQVDVMDAQYPVWWVKSLKKAYPETFKSILETNLLPAKMFLRVNTRHTTVAKYLEQLRLAQIPTLIIPQHLQELAPQAIALESSVPVSRLPNFEDGDISVQDLGAQIAAHLIDPQDQEKILDACAAPGGKASHLLELANLSLDILEISSERMKRVEENLKRLGLNGNLIIGDASEPLTWFSGQPYDAILADVPCSASGIIRRHPDILYLRRGGDITQLQKLQRQIISQLWSLLKPGGRMVFVTCSILPQEGEEQCIWFSKNLGNALRLDCIGQLLPNAWHDGFFYGMFEKTQ
jgi:16S rRNA (cytosine967-C5)-methyltransferase